MNALFLQFLKEMQNKGRLKFYENHLLSLVSTFGIGGRARVFVLPFDKDSLIDTVRFASKYGRYAVIGNASNLLFDDCGFDGTVISTVKIKGILPNRHGSFYAECGVMLPSLCAFAQKNGYEGFEGLCSIPATVGGAIFQNASAYGTQISDKLVSYEVYIPSQNRLCLKDADSCEFSYRKGPIKSSDEIVIGAYFRAEMGNIVQIKAKMDKNKALRRALQPIDVKSAGSYFRRPSENEGTPTYKGKSAGQLIDMCGLKGMTFGGAQVSNKHGNFIINASGNAKAGDVLTLANEVKKAVYEKTGVLLCEEVEYVSVCGKKD
jgi:UDP-N-acetylmuramate dehydrogenase